ncbi:MAG: class I SAM-dependent methyltransferase, partial [SAR324 cluster bacterium]|nr:class I SAM-dependent methyltransferase [SAR324 cluster bacterium]
DCLLLFGTIPSTIDSGNSILSSNQSKHFGYFFSINCLTNFFKIVPLIGKWLMPGQEMFDYLPHSSINYPDQKKLKKILLEEGFQKVDVYDFVFGASTIHVMHQMIKIE